MIGVPEHLYTRRADIARLEALIVQLPQEARVELHLTDGSRVTGTVSTRPSMQTFRNAKGVEGTNAGVRIDDRAHPEKAHYLWIDRIASVTSLGPA
ncbi:DUF3247 family protein [Pseudoxanthomonas putridarboris]|uniref:DUF3247 family protein n=1 Tax=Pseudoxanthomonas putridarboris TaxID=752605 RepID=A0ABU9J3F8_9GAMM